MFYLTPQERSVLAAFVTICLLGSLVQLALKRHAQPLQWTKTASRPFHKSAPDLNTAGAQALDSIPGIGPKLAANIIEHRNKHGVFLRLEELRKVKGITTKNFEKIRDYYNMQGLP
jgi:comEA protein